MVNLDTGAALEGTAAAFGSRKRKPIDAFGVGTPLKILDDLADGVLYSHHRIHIFTHFPSSFSVCPLTSRCQFRGAVSSSLPFRRPPRPRASRPFVVSAWPQPRACTSGSAPWRGRVWRDGQD